MDIFAKIAGAFERGGLWMWVILGVQLISVALIIERSYFLFFKRKIQSMSYVKKFESMIRRGQVEDVITAAQSSQDELPIARVAVAGATAAYNLGGRDEIQGKMDEVLMHETALIERRIGFLPMLGNVATLSGLLGTITGMIVSFMAVTYASPSEKAALLSAGISEAMYTTAYGLIVAIPALMMYAVLQNRADQLLEDLNQASFKLFNWLSYAYEPIGIRAKRNKKESSHTEMNA
jgi:biopolymer transport protein ExbB/TolQ